MKRSDFPTREKRGGGTDRFNPGAYLTDGSNLFRVSSVTSGSNGPTLVELENCRTLEASVYDNEAVERLDLVTITPAGGEE